MQNQNQNRRRESPPSARKPPRPPPLSLSSSSSSEPDPTSQAQAQARPETQPESSNSSESPRSPLRSESPIRSDDPEEKPRENNNNNSNNNKKNNNRSNSSNSNSNNNGAIVAVEKYYSPLSSPLPITPPKDAATPDNFPPPPPSLPSLPPPQTQTQTQPHHIISFNRRPERERPVAGVVHGGERKRVGFAGFGDEERERERGTPSVVSKGGDVVNKVALGIRVFEVVFCLVSFSVMATDRTQGWSGDSFDRYKEYRFCLTVNIIGFLYAGFQAYDLAYHLATGKHVIAHHLRYQFDFIMDQIISYLLISASSAAATRVADWEANWGKDEFTEKASASVSMAFLAFVAFAMSSLISGYNLCHRDLS